MHYQHLRTNQLFLQMNILMVPTWCQAMTESQPTSLPNRLAGIFWWSTAAVTNWGMFRSPRECTEHHDFVSVMLTKRDHKLGCS